MTRKITSLPKVPINTPGSIASLCCTARRTIFLASGNYYASKPTAAARLHGHFNQLRTDQNGIAVALLVCQLTEQR